MSGSTLLLQLSTYVGMGKETCVPWRGLIYSLVLWRATYSLYAWTVMWPQLKLGSWVRAGLSPLSILACYGPAVYTVPQTDATQGITFTSCLGSSEGYGTCSHECPVQGWISESWPKVVVATGLLCSSHSHCFRSGGKVPLSPLSSSSHTRGHPSPPWGVHVRLLITH